MAFWGVLLLLMVMKTKLDHCLVDGRKGSWCGREGSHEHTILYKHHSAVQNNNLQNRILYQSSMSE